MGLTLDSSALISLERAGKHPSVVLSNYDEELMLPAIVWAELLIGFEQAPDALKSGKAAWLQAAMRCFEFVPFDAFAASAYAQLFVELERRGTRIPPNDLQAAATARVRNCGMLVGPKGEAHFTRIPGLRVERLVA